MKKCIWFYATTFQSDILRYAYALAEKDDYRVVVEVENLEIYRQQQLEKLKPFPGEWVERNSPKAVALSQSLSPEVLVIDNHLPKRWIAPNILVVWHGYGWRIDDLRSMMRALKRHIGPVDRPNPHFLWQAIGEWDRRYRIDHTGIDPSNVLALGSPISDWLRPKAPFDFPKSSRRWVLMAMTWHHGAGPFSHWGKDELLMDRLVDVLRTYGAGLILRMHDRHRYKPDELERWEKWVQKYRGQVLLEFKDQVPDSWSAIQRSDVIISNYSSILNDFYYTLKPSLHIEPYGEGPKHYRKWVRGKVRTYRIKASPWKLSPEEIGGIKVQSFERLLEGLDKAFREPDLCRAKTLAFLNKHVTKVDGYGARRLEEAMHFHLRL